MKAWELKAQQEKAYQDMCGTQAQADKPYYGDQCTQGLGGAPRRASLREEAEQQGGFHREQANKCDMAAAFFRENPAFDEFIRLIRSGAVQI